MSGSPLLLSSDGGKKWHVLGIYTERAMGKLTRAAIDIKDYYRAEGTLKDCKFNFQVFDDKLYTEDERADIRA